MTSIRIRDLIDMIASETPEPGKSLEKVFEWAHSRAADQGQSSLSTVRSLGNLLVSII